MKKSKQQGFSLLEVLVAFSIFALSIGIIFQIYSTGTRSTALSDEYARAMIIARAKLTRAGIEQNNVLKEQSGIEQEKFEWVVTINEIDDDEDYLETRYQLVKHNVEVEVHWKSMSKNRSVKLNTIKLLPVS